jgi:hypothetical protein
LGSYPELHGRSLRQRLGHLQRLERELEDRLDLRHRLQLKQDRQERRDERLEHLDQIRRHVRVLARVSDLGKQPRQMQQQLSD